MKYIKKNKNVDLEKKNSLISNICDRFKDCSDFSCSKIIAENTGVEIYKIYINEFVDKQLIDETILKPIAENVNKIFSSTDLLNTIKSGKVYYTDVKVEIQLEKIIDSLLSANFVLVCENQAFIFDSTKLSKRSIVKPENEVAVKGAQEGFIESSATNIALVRKRLKTDKLKVLEEQVGEETKTKVNIVYVEGIAKEELIRNIKERVKNVDVPSIVSVGDFEEHIIDRKYSIFPQAIVTERPDKVAANLIEGKVAIFIDGFPTVYIAPAVLAMFMQATEEYNVNYFVSSMIRALRYVCLFISILIPALYVAITTFHQEMLPTTLAESIIQSKQNVPLPAFLEIIIMLIAFEILLEAGARMPKTAGQTVSIVGALIVGDAAVNAQFVSPAVVVIVAIAAICGFVIPNQDLANTIRINRLLLVICSSIAGFFRTFYSSNSTILLYVFYTKFWRTIFKTVYIK